MWSNYKYRKALIYAATKHDAQKMYQPAGVTYLAHICGVTNFALNACIGKKGVDLDYLIQVALLHDVIEDTAATYEDIVSNFGKCVANGVLALSKNKNLSLEQQIPDSVNRIMKQRKEVWIIKLADRLFNMHDIPVQWSVEKAQRYKKEAVYICEKLGKANPNLEKQLQIAITNYNQKISGIE